jgi:hypothetical protein
MTLQLLHSKFPYIWEKNLIIFFISVTIYIFFCSATKDQITIKTPNSKCGLYCCWIELIGWRYSQSRWYFRPLLWTSSPLGSNLLTGSPPPPLSCVNTVSTGVCKKAGEISGCVESIYRSFTLCIWPDSRPTKLLYHPMGASDREKSAVRSL